LASQQLQYSNMDKCYWQEKITWNVIKNFFDSKFGEGTTATDVSVDIKQIAIWTHGACEVELNWFTPNTHPEIVGKQKKPDFSISVNGTDVAAIESKNHNVRDLWSMARFKDQVLTRFQSYAKTLPKILVIGKFLPAKSDGAAIEKLLKDQHIRVIETGRQATSSADVESSKAIKSQLEPILRAIVWRVRVWNWKRKITQLLGRDYD